MTETELHGREHVAEQNNLYNGRQWRCGQEKEVEAGRGKKERKQGQDASFQSTQRPSWLHHLSVMPSILDPSVD